MKDAIRLRYGTASLIVLRAQTAHIYALEKILLHLCYDSPAPLIP